MITNLYIIRSLNSEFEVQVGHTGVARCRKNGGDWKSVQVPIGDMSFLDELTIGLPFTIPGCYEPTSNVRDYQSFIPSGEEKRRYVGGIKEMTDAILAPLRPHVVVVNDDFDPENYH